MAKNTAITVSLKQWLDYLEPQVNVTLYVWGANDELCVNLMNRLVDMEKDDHTKEEALNNVDRTLTLLQKRLLQGCDMLKIHCADCSGLAVGFLLKMGVIKSDMTANSLYNLTKGHEVKLSDVQAGDYLFNGNDDKKWHVGYAISNKYAIESQDHDKGVVKTKISERPWKYATRPNWYSDQPKPEKPVLTRELYLTDPYMKGDDVKDCQNLLVDKGYNPGVVDGIYGKKTMEAVKDFQIDEDLGIKRLGTVGKKTATALGFIWEG